MTDILVIDTETTTRYFNCEGGPDGNIVEVGVARVDLESRRVYPELSMIVNAPADGDEWVFQNTSLTVKDVENGRHASEADTVLARMINHRPVAFYNADFDCHMIDRDLRKTALTICLGSARIDLMEIAAKIEEIPRSHAGENVYPKAIAAYDYLCPDDPCGLNGVEEHRALSDAVMEGHILLALDERGLIRRLSP